MLAADFGDSFVEVGVRVVLPGVPRIAQREIGVVLEQLGQSILQQRPVVMRDRETVSLKTFDAQIFTGGYYKLYLKFTGGSL